MRRLRRMGPGLALVTVSISAVSASAHSGGTTGYAFITVSRSTVRYSLTLPTSALPSDLAEALRPAPAGRPANRGALLGLIRSRIVLHADGIRCEPGPGHVMSATPDAPTFTMLVDFACGGAVRKLVVQDNVFDVLGADHHTLAKVEAPSGIQQFAFAPDTRQARFEFGGGDVVRSAGSFLMLGIEHILTGYDHLLFLLGLLLRGGSWFGLAAIVTAFTLAHSVTLALAVLDVVTLPARLVEAVIALSIAVVAAENVFRRPAVPRRWLVSFCFGLVHGFGFSSALRELGLPAHGLALALVGFNAGVELGQGLVVAAALPLLALVRRVGWEAQVIWSSSLAILVVGVVLFVERAFF